MGRVSTEDIPPYLRAAAKRSARRRYYRGGAKAAAVAWTALRRWCGMGLSRLARGISAEYERGLTEREFWIILTCIILIAHMLTLAHAEVYYADWSPSREDGPVVVLSNPRTATPEPSKLVPEATPVPQDPIVAAALEFNIPLDVAYALIEQESGGNPTAVSHVGALGIAQVMPETGKSIAQELGIVQDRADFDPQRLIDDPILNLRFGMYYLRKQWDRFQSLELALAAYNAGPNAVIEWGGIPPYPETLHYVESITALKERYR